MNIGLTIRLGYRLFIDNNCLTAKIESRYE